jgi:hypothetical protein
VILHVQVDATIELIQRTIFGPSGLGKIFAELDPDWVVRRRVLERVEAEAKSFFDAHLVFMF